MKVHSLLSHSLALSLLFALPPLSAQADIMRCEKNGQVIYQHDACPKGTNSLGQLKPLPAPSEKQKKEARRQADQDKKQADQMRGQRLKREEKSERETKRAIASSEKARVLCDKAKLRVKWAEEDARGAGPKQENKARQKLRREKEKAELSCKNSR